MKIAIACQKKSLDENVSAVSGRAKNYLIFENKNLVKTIKNPFAFGGGGAGFGVAEMLADENVDAAIAGEFGQNMISALKQKGIKTIVSTKTIKQALDEALKK